MSTLHFPTSRWGAAATHFGFSAILLFIIIGLVYFIWYPGALTFAGGAEDGLKIVIAVDMILGPLLTLVIYNITKPKKELVRDLSIIALFQFSCLIAGMNLVYEQRPLAIIYDTNSFQIYDAKKLEEGGIQINLLDKYSGAYPKLILEKPPKDPSAIAQHSINKLLGTLDVSTLWESFPEDPSLLTQLFQVEESLHCTTRNIQSYHSNGIICFNPKTLSFSNFQKL